MLIAFSATPGTAVRTHHTLPGETPWQALAIGGPSSIWRSPSPWRCGLWCWAPIFCRTVLGESRDDAFSVASADADEPTAISPGQDGGSALEQLRAATDDGVADKHLGKRELRSIHRFPLTAEDRQPRITNAAPR